MIRILITEDDKDLLEILQLRLEVAGFCIETAVNGQEALDRIDQSAPDIALLDIFMPVKNGIQVVQALRADQKTKDLPVIFISGSLEAVDEVKRNVQNLSVQGYITKPFDFKQLVSTIHQILGR